MFEQEACVDPPVFPLKRVQTERVPKHPGYFIKVPGSKHQASVLEYKL